MVAEYKEKRLNPDSLPIQDPGDNDERDYKLLDLLRPDPDDDTERCVVYQFDLAGYDVDFLPSMEEEKRSELAKITIDFENSIHVH